MKITFFQKKLNSKITSTELTKLSKEKSDFLLFPAGFAIQLTHSIPESITRYDSILDQLMNVSENFKGVILGGTLIRKDSRGKSVESVPIVQDLNFIDHYDLQIPTNSNLSVGDSETIFIMAGVRFGLLAGVDYENPEILEKLQKKGIQTVFILDGAKNSRTYEDDLDYFFNLAKNYSFNVFRICGYDLDRSRLGRSLVATPTGIQWKVGKMEEDKDIIKTIHFPQANPFL